MNAFPYGAVLKVQREFSLDTIKAKLDDMKRCGMNLAVIWPAVFWWEDRADPAYPFRTGLEILEHARKIGMKIIMELAGQITALEYAPDFVMKPDYYAVKRDGIARSESFVFDYLNFNHPEVKTLIRKSFTEIAGAYKDCEALYGYDIWNETMFTSYDRYTLQLYREWLERKYGTIEKLNAVWDRTYYDWSQIEFNFWLWPSVMPHVDWQQFRKANVGMILNEWRSYVKSVDPKRPVIADNIGSMVASDQFYQRPHDDWNAAENTDEYGISFYPKETPEGTPAYKRWQTFAGVHSATADGRFWISELQSHHRNMFRPGSAVHPHELKWWSLEAIAHGARGIVYWKWDPFIKGNQTAGRGLVDARGTFTPRAHAAADIAAALRRLPDNWSEYKPEQPRVAIVFDRLTQDFVKTYAIGAPEETSLYVHSVGGLYECLWELNIPAKFITPEDLVQGKANEYRVGPDLARAVRAYVEQGGTVVADGKFGIIREDGLLNENLPGGDLNPLLGCRLIDIDSQQLDIELRGDAGDEGSGLLLPGYFERNMLAVENERAEIWGRHPDGLPSVVASSAGKGRIIYISTMVWYGYNREPKRSLLDWMRRLDERYGMSLHPGSGDSPLKWRTMTGDGGMLLFVFNYSGEAVESEIVLHTRTMETVRSVMELTGSHEGASAVRHGDQLAVSVRVPGNDVAVYKLSWRD
jgi:beta-galactosidase